MTPMAIMDFVQRFQALQIPRDNEEALIKDILVYCEALGNENIRLSKELQDAQLDIDDARRSRRELQQKLNMALQSLGQANSDIEAMRLRNPYIQVLIDGDGMIFKEELLRQGIEGGKQAASTLRNAVLQTYGSEFTDDIEIIASIYANCAGLSNAMLRDGCIDVIDQFKDFMVGFTQGKASFDFVNVGHGKERADSKIKELARWHQRNYNCKKILLGISHDAGYAPFLDEVVKHDDHTRVTIIEGPPTVRELISTGLQITPFPTLFRSTKLTDRTKSLTPSTTTTTSSLAPTSWAGVTSIPPTSPSPIITPNGLATPRSASASAHTTPRPTSSKPVWTPQPRGLDPTVRVDPAVMSKIKGRTASNKLCNNHYLRRSCGYGSECTFEHKYRANEEEMKALEFMARLIPCSNGQECDVVDCIYGHHCPGTVVLAGKTPVCNVYGCRFEEEGHPPGTCIKHPRERDY